MSILRPVLNLFKLSPTQNVSGGDGQDIVQSKSIMVGNNNPVFLIITTPTCGSCKVFKDQHYTSLMNSMSKIDHVRTIHLDLNHMLLNASKFTGSKGEKVPLCARYLHNRVPVFFMIDGADWNEATTDANITNAKFEMKHTRFEGPVSADELYKWALSTGKTMNLSVSLTEPNNNTSDSTLNMKGVPYNPDMGTVLSPKKTQEPVLNMSSATVTRNNISAPFSLKPNTPSIPSLPAQAGTNYVDSKASYVYKSKYTF